MAAHGWSLRKLYTVLELPGENPLKDAHADLDNAVLEAYGMKDEAEVLQTLFELNAALFERQESKETVIGPGLAALGAEYGDNAESYTTDDRIEP